MTEFQNSESALKYFHYFLAAVYRFAFHTRRKGKNAMGNTRITAEFDSIDSADRAASALRHRVNGILNISCKPHHPIKEERDPAFLLSAPASFSGLASGASQSGAYLSIAFNTDLSPNPTSEPLSGTEAILTVELMDEYAHSADSLLRSFGGLSVNSLSL